MVLLDASGQLRISSRKSSPEPVGTVFGAIKALDDKTVVVEHEPGELAAYSLATGERTQGWQLLPQRVAAALLVPGAQSLIALTDNSVVHVLTDVNR